MRIYGVNMWYNIFDKYKGLFISMNDKLKIMMRTEGTIIFFMTMSNTGEELENCIKGGLIIQKTWRPQMVIRGDFVKRRNTEKWLKIVIKKLRGGYMTNHPQMNNFSITVNPVCPRSSK